MITTILSVAFIIFAAIIVLMGVLKAKKHYWVEYVSKLIITVFSAFFAAWLTSVLSVKLSNPILASINSSSKITWLNGILSDLPSSKKVLGALIAFAISGILFFIIYIILKAALKAIFTKPLTMLFLVIAGAITKKNYIAKAYPKGVKKAKKDKKEAVNYGKENFIKAAIFGALCAFVSYIIILVPIVASLEFTANMTTLALPEGIPTEISEKLPKALSDFPDALVDNVGSKTVMTIGGRQIHNIYASVSVDGEKINFSNEMAVAVDIVKGVAAITDKDLSSEEKGDAIRSTTDHIDNTVIIPTIASEFINEAGEDWIEGEHFHSIPRPSLGKGSDDIVIALLTCLQGSTLDTIKEDLHSIANILAIIAENNTGSTVNFTKILSNKTIVSKISVEVLDNERLAPVIKHLMVLNLSSVKPTINIKLPDENDPSYNDFIDKVVNGYLENISTGDTEKSLENITTVVNQSLVEHNVEVEEGMDTVIAAALIGEYGDGKEMTSENLKAFISENITQYTAPQSTVA